MVIVLIFRRSVKVLANKTHQDCVMDGYTVILNNNMYGRQNLSKLTFTLNERVTINERISHDL